MMHDGDDNVDDHDDDDDGVYNYDYDIVNCSFVPFRHRQFTTNKSLRDRVATQIIRIRKALSSKLNLIAIWRPENFELNLAFFGAINLQIMECELKNTSQEKNYLTKASKPHSYTLPPTQSHTASI